MSDKSVHVIVIRQSAKVLYTSFSVVFNEFVWAINVRFLPIYFPEDDAFVLGAANWTGPELSADVLLMFPNF